MRFARTAQLSTALAEYMLRSQRGHDRRAGSRTSRRAVRVARSGRRACADHARRQPWRMPLAGSVPAPSRAGAWGRRCCTESSAVHGKTADGNAYSDDERPHLAQLITLGLVHDTGGQLQLSTELMANLGLRPTEEQMTTTTELSMTNRCNLGDAQHRPALGCRAQVRWRRSRRSVAQLDGPGRAVRGSLSLTDPWIATGR
jgi:hypothetical protein